MSAVRTLVDFQRNNYYRSPQWRWDRVLEMARRGPTPFRCSRRDDAYIRAGHKFNRALGNREEESERRELFWDTPGLFYAWQIFDKHTEDATGGQIIQARLLARQSNEEIAKAMSTIPETIEWYEAMFFNVSDRLDNRDWITAQILLPAILRNQQVRVSDDSADPPRFRDPVIARPFLDGSLKMFAYFGGPYLVDLMITGFQQGKPLASPDGIAAWLDGHWATTIRRRSAQAALEFNVNNFNVTELFTIHTRIIEIDRSQESADSQQSNHERHVKAMLDEIPWAVGQKGADQFKGSLLGRLDDMHGELRDDEVLKITSGQPVEGLKDNFPDKLPPPRRNPTVLGARKADF